MQTVYVKKPAGDRKSWMDQFVALDPKGGVHEVIERIQNGTPSNHDESGANGWGALMAVKVADTELAA